MPKLKQTDEDVISADNEQQSRQPERVQFDITSDAFTVEDQDKIVELFQSDYEAGILAMADWVKQKELDAKCYNGNKPSELEGVKKKAWQSDRNTGLFAAVADTIIAVLKATCWNPDSIEMQPNGVNNVDNSKALRDFNLWSVGKDEGNTEPEIHDFIHNRVNYGFSAFKTYWKVWYEWVDERIPKYDKNSKHIIKYNIETEYKRFEKGVTENIANVDDLIIPSYGKDIQTLPWVILRNHMLAGDVIAGIDSKIFTVKNVDEYKASIRTLIENERSLEKEKNKQQGITDTVSDADIESYPVEIYEYYRKFKKNNKFEEYRFYVDLKTQQLLAGKPIRKITRTGKRPLHGGPFISVPGQIRGKSIHKLIFNIVCMVNNAFNQKSDFQYVNNCPFGFRDVSNEESTTQEMELMPMTIYGTDGPPSEKVYFPNIQRSLAWAESDFRLFFEMLERITGAATYFMTQRNQSNTLGQDMLVDRASETRFGIWVSGILRDISAALTMRLQLYQDWAPPNLGQRVLGKEGKQLFKNLSIDTLRGNYEVSMKPDFVAGSRAMRQQIYMWGFQALQQTVWLNPQINPKGNYNLILDSAKFLMNLSDAEAKRYLGKEPPGQEDYEGELEAEWQKFMQGDVFDPPEGMTPLAIQHLEGHMKQKEKINELDKAYRPNFEAHLFKTAMNVQDMMREAAKQQIANTLAARMIGESRGVPAFPAGQGAPQPGMGAGMPGAANPAQPKPMAQPMPMGGMEGMPQ